MSSETVARVAADSPAVVAEIATGQGISLAQAAKLFPPARLGRPLHPATLWRWARDGLRLPKSKVKVHLEVARVGCRWLTSQAAVQRFLVAMNPPTDTQQQPQPAPRAAAARRAAEAAAAQAQLRTMGV